MGSSGFTDPFFRRWGFLVRKTGVSGPSERSLSMRLSTSMLSRVSPDLMWRNDPWNLELC